MLGLGAPPAAPLFRLAWRNVWRHRRRTVLLIVVVAYATFFTVLLWGYMEGFFASILNDQARLVSAPVLVQTARHRDDPDPENALPDLAFVPDLLRQPGVQAASPRLEFPALLRSAYASEGTLIRGVDPGLESEVSRVPRLVGSGRMLARTGEVVLGVELARRLDARPGERIVVDTASMAGPQAAGLVVVGLVKSGVMLVDQSVVLVHLDDARRLTGVGTATGVALDVRRGHEDVIAGRIQPFLPEGVRAYGLSELLGAFQKVIVTHEIEMIPLGLIFSVVAVIAVTSTVLVSVIERTREFGMITALGLGPTRLARVVILEAVTATMLGWAVGLVFGYAATLALGHWNVLGPIIGRAYGQAFASLGMSGEIYAASKPIYALYASVTVAMAAVFALLAPARRVRRLEPGRALRVE